jgi:hypothetical protein
MVEEGLDERLRSLMVEMDAVLALKKREQFDGVEIKTGPPKPVQQPPHSSKPTIHAQRSAKKPEPRAEVPLLPQGPLRPVAMVPKPTDPKHRYQSPIEQGADVSKICDRFLDGKFEVSGREIAQVSPEVRKVLKDLVTGKRVETVNAVEESTDVYLSQFKPPPTTPLVETVKFDPVTAASSLPLRVIYPTFPDGVRAECILDGGAQIVVMRSDIYRKIHSAILYPSKAIMMESANAKSTMTLGQIKDLPMTIGPVTVHLQVHVVEEAAFEVLLGRPFFDAVSCTEISRTGGDHAIEIINPRNQEPVIVQTIPRPGSAVNFRR